MLININGITAQGSDVTLSKEEFQWLCMRSLKADRMKKYAKMSQNSSQIVLTANDLLYFWLYNGTDETIPDTISC